MLQKVPAGKGKPGQPPMMDLRGLKAVEARSKAFQMMFGVKPGQRVAILVNSTEGEREVMKWLEDVGHRFLKTVRCEDNGSSYSSMEIIKMEARR
jgi:hypothetical protein